jgi:1-acyl-sn-glycerol-3-phosphate acyltransferase
MNPRRLRWLPAPVVGVLTFVAMLIALLFWVLPLFVPVALLKLLLPFPAAQRLLGGALAWIAGSGWVGTNHFIFAALHGRRRAVSLSPQLDPAQSWLVVSNHQSWADILILFDVLWRRAPLPRFFLKRELIWVPLIGLICWALDMPFMTRAGKSAIAANPALARRDLETTRRFCEKYRGHAITVVNYVEGTRCTEAKRLARRSSYRHLLAPKSGGLAFTISAMGEQFAGLVDVTLVYQPTGAGRSKLWSFLCGEQRDAVVQVAVEPLPPAMLTGDYAGDPVFRTQFQQWVGRRWSAKDDLIEQLRSGGPAARPGTVAASIGE